MFHAPPIYPAVAAILLSLCVSACEIDDSPPPSEAQASHTGQRSMAATVSCFDALVSSGRAAGTLSGAAAVVRVDGRLRLRRGWGTVSPESRRRVRATTRFRAASVTKLMTAIAVQSLVDDEVLVEDARVVDFVDGFDLPGAEGWVEELTPHTLLTHQGAIRELTLLDAERDDGALRAAFTDPGFQAAVPLWARPGSFWNYSNQNFMVAGLLAEAAAETPYRDLMQERVFRPLRMRRATFLPAVVLQDENFAVGIDGDLVYQPDDYDNAWARPSGWAWASVADLGRLADFVARGNRRVLSPRGRQAVVAYQVDMRTNLDLSGYGYGLFVDRFLELGGSFYDGVETVSHGGNLPGYTSLVSTIPELGFSYAAVVNGSVLNAELSQCAQAAISETVASRLPLPSTQPDPQIEPDRFADYVGRYEDPVGVTGPAIVEVAPTGELRAQFALLDQVGIPYEPVLVPVSRDNFAFSIQGIQLRLTGIRSRADEVVYLRTRPFVLTRSSETSAARIAVDAPATSASAVKARIENALRELGPSEASAQTLFDPLP